MESKDETNCQAREGPILCVNNCGFFGSAATMNMCSKCHKEMISQQEQTKLAMSSIENIANRGLFANNPVVATSAAPPLPAVAEVALAVPTEVPECSGGVPPKEGPKRCTTCRKRLGLTGFTCRCGNLFCSSHRYSDKHDCQFDYQKAGRDAIARANPVVKTDKLDKI